LVLQTILDFKRNIMARFYSHEEITKDLILSKEQVGDLAKKIEQLPSFQNGNAVIF